MWSNKSIYKMVQLLTHLEWRSIYHVKERNIVSLQLCVFIKDLQSAVFAAALNDALKSELQRLKMATGQMGSNVGGMNFMGPPPPHSFGGNQPIFHIQGQAAMQPMHQMQMRPHHHQPLLHPLQLQAQQLQLQHQAAAGAAQQSNLKMKRTISAPNQWIGGWSESSGN
jgi:hypothetical protein